MADAGLNRRARCDLLQGMRTSGMAAISSPTSSNIELRAGGEVYDVWNSLPEGEGPLQRYRGDPAANNVSLNAGGATSFGLCMECTPASE